MNRDTTVIWDEYLVLHAQSGSQDALSRLLSRYQIPLLSYIARLCGDAHEAQDILQEVYLTVCRQLKQLRDPARFRPWLYRIATHRCRDWQRRDYGRARLLGRPGEMPEDWENHADPTTESQTQQLEIQQILAQLSAEERALLSLFYLQGFALSELAETFETSLGAMKTRLYRARQQFQQRWAAIETVTKPAPMTIHSTESDDEPKY